MHQTVEGDNTSVHPDLVAQLVAERYEKLPAKFKPRHRDGNQQEWTILSGIVLSSNSQRPTCVCLATGMQCLPASKIRLASGTILHDWHAEVLVIRAFNRWLLDECAASLQEPSPWVARRSIQPPFVFRDDVSIHMYCSDAPCGDASMELVMAEQGDATPWLQPNSQEAVTADGSEGALRGRGYFAQLGVVRTKPSRPDAPLASSKSCSDKLAMKQCTSILGSPLSLLVESRSAFVRTVTIPASQHVPIAVERAFGASGRMAVLAQIPDADRPSGFVFDPFTIRTTASEFQYAKRGIRPGKACVASNISAVWTPRLREVLINGVLQGRKQFDQKGASKLSRKTLWIDAAHLADAVGCRLAFSTNGTYGDFKYSEALQGRQEVKAIVRLQALKGWVQNRKDEDFPYFDSP